MNHSTNSTAELDQTDEDILNEVSDETRRSQVRNEPRNREHGRPRNAPKNHSRMDGPSEG